VPVDLQSDTNLAGKSTIDPSVRVAGGISGAGVSLALRHSLERDQLTRSTRSRNETGLHEREGLSCRVGRKPMKRFGDEVGSRDHVRPVMRRPRVVQASGWVGSDVIGHVGVALRLCSTIVACAPSRTSFPDFLTMSGAVVSSDAIRVLVRWNSY
jgi:hypothetical protein